MIKGMQFRRDLVFIGFILPAFIGYLIFYLYPMFATFIYSFTDWTGYRKEINFVGLDNFVKLFHDEDVTIGIKNSVIYALAMTIFQNGLAIPLAVALHRPLKSRNLLRTIFFLPAILSPMVVGFLWSYIMSATDHGVLNQLLVSVGFNKVNWLGDPDLALYSVIFTQIWQWTGYAMVIYLANLQGISKELYESAGIDGTNGWQNFWYITLPMLIPAITFNTVMSMIGGLKVFDVIFAMTHGGPGHSTETIVMTLITKGITHAQYGYGSAFAVVFSLLIMLITFIQLRVLKRWEEKLF
ncbi:ABC transporter permease subunit [Paenibacillus sp. LMG 31458]|jgi:raffinose/stachyose/melibiose transport system permease protein|uniref:ABC transporter permease subunit n=1 Tax=Paenibacillus phytorum TaxID=2654977 RepID=A0ABX1XTN7_9BACL|nr:sugar ABC transporter permease [Paenibacillus phytorum]NOU71744.1 ABC transporter permease subunit [Paenibacillus phytorum]